MARKNRAFKQGSNWLNASIVGIQFPVAMALGYFWGKWMDGLFGTHPWLTIIFFILGIETYFLMVSTAANGYIESGISPLTLSK